MKFNVKMIFTKSCQNWLQEHFLQLFAIYYASTRDPIYCASSKVFLMAIMGDNIVYGKAGQKPKKKV